MKSQADSFSILLSLAGGVALWLAAESPLLFMNSYLVPAFALATTGVIAGHYGKSRSGWSLGAIAGIAVLIGCFAVYGVASVRWHKISNSISIRR